MHVCIYVCLYDTHIYIHINTHCVLAFVNQFVMPMPLWEIKPHNFLSINEHIINSSKNLHPS